MQVDNSPGPDHLPDTAVESGNGDRWGNLAEQLAGYRGPGYRKAYLARFLEDGRRFDAEGDARGARHCFDRVKAILETAPAPSVQVENVAAGSRIVAPLERLHRRWREEGLRRAWDLLARHARRLSPLESEAYGKRLARFSSPQEPSSNERVNSDKRIPGDKRIDGEEKANVGTSRHPAGPRSEASIPLDTGTSQDTAWMEFRRRLYRRILQSQKAALSFGKGLPRKESIGTVSGRTVGPYNDRHNLEGLLDFIAGMEPAWVEEFTAHYRDLSRLRDRFAGNGKPGTR